MIEQEMMEKDRQYNSLQEEVEEQRKIIKKLRQKYQQAESELNAINRDQNDVRAELTDTIREQEKDLDFLNAVVGMMLKEGEMYRLKEKIEYDFDAGKWKVPAFIIKNKEVNFPKIRMAMNLVKEEKNQREIVMADTGEVIDSANGSGSGDGNFGQKHLGISNTFKNQSSSKQQSRQRHKRVERHQSGMAEGSVDSASNAFGSGPYNNFNGSSRGVARVRQGSIEDNRFGVDYYASGKQTAGDHNSSSSENLDSGMKYGHRLGNENHAS